MTSLEDKVKWVEREDKKQDPLEFFRQHYCHGTTRSRLARKDFSLYRILSRRSLLDDAIPDFHIKVSKFGGDPVAYYRQHYAGLTRGQLHKKDPSLYERLRIHGLLWHVPTRFHETRFYMQYILKASF